MGRVWLVRLGRFGEQEAAALATGELATGWVIPRFPSDKSRENISEVVEETYPNEKAGTLQNWAVQLNQLANVISPGDLTVTPLKTTGQVAIGRVEGDFHLNEEGRPSRRVTWIRKDLSRDAVKQDLLYSLGASQTICEVKRNDAARRFDQMVATGIDPGPAPTGNFSSHSSSVDGDIVEEKIDLAITARDQIERHIAANFVGHAFTELVAAILKADGYQIRVSPPGADKGVDIVAGLGSLGFESPRLVVQVKSGGMIADQPTLQSLIGTIQDTHADHGLLVSWGGFTPPVRQRINDLYFRVRLWGRDEFMDALLSAYPRLPENIRSELPLRPVWTLVVEE